MKSGGKSAQLKKFHREFTSLFPNTDNLEEPDNWDTAFKYLSQAISLIPLSQKIILFFDELPWLASPKSHLLEELEYYWNRHFSQRPNVLIILCGSAASWMINKIIRNKAGLYGRLSDQIRIEPFTLPVVAQLLAQRNIQLDKKQLIELYMVVGGVANYYQYVVGGKSVAQIIDQLCFSPQGSLLTEFTDLFFSLFDKAELHIKIVRLLASKRTGLTRDKIIAQLKLASGGGITRVVDELVTSGFIMVLNEYHKLSKEKRYRLADEYSLFYLKWIEPVRGNLLQGIDDHHWLKQRATQTYKIWSGYSFETLCLKHSKLIKQALGISGITTEIYHWSREVEIDFVIDRADHCINLCEIKFYDGQFIMTKQYAEQLTKKRQLFKQLTNTKKTVFITMITLSGALENEYYHAVVDNQLIIENLL